MQPRQMVRPRIKEISGVDHPAHLTEGWLLMKSADADTAAILAEAEAVAKGIAPATTKESNMGLAPEVRSALPDDVAEYIKSLEDDVTKAKAVRKSAKDEAKEFEKALEGMAPSVQEQFRKQQRSLAEAEAVSKALFDERETARFEEMAKSLVHLPGVTPAGFGSTLRKAADTTDAATFDGIFSVLKAADAAIKESGLFKEIGTGHHGTSDAQASLEAIAKELQTKDNGLTYSEAIVKAAELNPDLYAQHRQEA